MSQKGAPVFAHGADETGHERDREDEEGGAGDAGGGQRLAEYSPRKRLPKTGDLLCTPYLDFVRGLPCSFCARKPRSQAHHFPGKGRAGLQDDSTTLPVCARCHKRCEGETVEGKSPINDASQRTAIEQVRLRFFKSATPYQWAELGKARAERAEAVVF